MIRQISSKDKISVAMYLAKKLNISLHDATIKANKIIKNGQVSFLKEEKDLSGLCYIESKIVNGIKIKFIEILCDNWRLAEAFLQCLRWELNGIYWFSVPKHDFLNRTLNKNGIRFVKVDGDKNTYNFQFEKRIFHSIKLDDMED